MKTPALLSLVPVAGLLVAPVHAASAPRTATFEARHELTLKIPAGAKQVRVWFAMPQKDPLQQVSNFKVTAPHRHSIKTAAQGNETVCLEVRNPAPREFSIVQTFTISRQEQISGVDAAKARPLTADELQRFAPELAANQHVIIDERVKKLAAEIVGGERNTVVAARKIYDWVLANIEYWVKHPATLKASPVGSTEYCLITKMGNCTDFHSLWTSRARAAGIPTRMIYGSFFKAELDGKDADQSTIAGPSFTRAGSAGCRMTWRWPTCSPRVTPSTTRT